MNKIVGIYLAAGTSKRMGTNKLALPFGEERLGSTALITILQSDVDDTIVVTNPNDEFSWISPMLVKNKNWRSFKCLDAEKGQSHSLKYGLQKAIEWDADAVMIFLADQPFISIKIINELIYLYKKCRKDFVAPCFAGLMRPPIIFSKKLYPLLLQLEGDTGARQIIRGELKERGTVIEYLEGHSFIDIDCAADYVSAIKLQKGRETI